MGFNQGEQYNCATAEDTAAARASLSHGVRRGTELFDLSRICRSDIVDQWVLSKLEECAIWCNKNFRLPSVTYLGAITFAFDVHIISHRFDIDRSSAFGCSIGAVDCVVVMVVVRVDVVAPGKGVIERTFVDGEEMSRT